MAYVALLLFLPLSASLLLFASRSKKWQYSVVAAVLLLSGGVSLSLFDTFSEPLVYHFSETLEHLFVVADVALLLFFIYVGIRYRDQKVGLLALLQLLLYAIAEVNLGAFEGAALIVDRLSVTMFTVINIVGGIIVLYAVRYMQDEAMSSVKKRLFTAYLLIFLSVMNLLVIANSLLLFFFLFEMTTLASYLLIRFREDETARRNALRALWMNQVGGVVILCGTLIAISGFETLYFDQLMSLDGGYLLFSVALLSMAALVKGASMPFDSWLLGAMVAPTPVSAMLHSATMVKIAPFLILKFAPLLAGTVLGGTISVMGSMVFVGASYLALSKTLFKEILGYSTIALLGLMMSLAAIGTEESLQVAVVLIIFHALSKALLFLAAGSVEKLHHLKNIEGMKGLAQYAPKSVFFIIFGFMTLVLPPFGLFMGKLFALQVVAEKLMHAPWQILVLIGIAVGGVLLALLYFKVVSALLSKESDSVAVKEETLTYGFAIPMAALSILIVSASVGLLKLYGTLSWWYLVAAALLFLLIPWFYRFAGRYDRTVEYHCGEKASFDAALFYFDMSTALKKRLYWFFGTMFALVGFAGVIS